jgi:N-acetylmuramoyl-L-alanine amidase
MSKKLTFLVIHCSATAPGVIVTKKEITHWHLVENGWHKRGYRDLILLDGLIENLEEFDHDANVDPWEITNGVRGYNGISAHICYAGGVDTLGNPMDTRTVEQVDTLTHYCHMMIRRHPDIIIAAHGALASKDCPCFDVPKFLCGIGIPQKNIFTNHKH